jgi:predicted DNA-binding transcriptional regulator YafY
VSGLRTTTAIVDAIGNRRLLAFEYHGRARVVEPHTFGLDRWGRSVLSAYQVECASGSKPSIGWRSFFVEQMSDVRIDQRRFATPRPDFLRGDGAFKSITAELWDIGAAANEP